MREWFASLAPFKVKAIAVLGPDRYDLRGPRQVIASHPSSFAAEAGGLARSDAFGAAWRSSGSPLAAWKQPASVLGESEEWLRPWLDRGAPFVVRVDFPTALDQGFECFIFCGPQPLGAEAAKQIAYTALGFWPAFRGEMVRSRHGITPRELQVLIAVAEGLNTKDISERMGCSQRTVAYHLVSVEQKLRANNRPALIQRASTLGIL